MGKLETCKPAKLLLIQIPRSCSYTVSCNCNHFSCKICQLTKVAMPIVNVCHPQDDKMKFVEHVRHFLHVILDSQNTIFCWGYSACYYQVQTTIVFTLDTVHDEMNWAQMNNAAPVHSLLCTMYGWVIATYPS